MKNGKGNQAGVKSVKQTGPGLEFQEEKWPGLAEKSMAQARHGNPVA